MNTVFSPSLLVCLFSPLLGTCWYKSTLKSTNLQPSKITPCHTPFKDDFTWAPGDNDQHGDRTPIHSSKNWKQCKSPSPSETKKPQWHIQTMEDQTGKEGSTKWETASHHGLHAGYIKLNQAKPDKMFLGVTYGNHQTSSLKRREIYFKRLLMFISSQEGRGMGGATVHIEGWAYEDLFCTNAWHCPHSHVVYVDQISSQLSESVLMHSTPWKGLREHRVKEGFSHWFEEGRGDGQVKVNPTSSVYAHTASNNGSSETHHCVSC